MARSTYARRQAGRGQKAIGTSAKYLAIRSVKLGLVTAQIEALNRNILVKEPESLPGDRQAQMPAQAQCLVPAMTQSCRRGDVQVTTKHPAVQQDQRLSQCEVDLFDILITERISSTKQR